MIGRCPVVWIVVRNSAHVRLLSPCAAALASRGHNVRYARRMGHRLEAQTLAELAGLGAEAVDALDLDHLAAPGDCIVFPTPPGPFIKNDRWRVFHERGIPLVQVQEGCRFLAERKYRPDLPFSVLGWGPSMRALGLPDYHPVGSPVLELARNRGKTRKPGKTALINYKFTFAEAELDTDLAWADMAAGAAEAAGFEPVLSIHPNTRLWPLAHARSARPVADLVQEAAVLISRSSTVIYEALAAGVPVVFAAVEGEALEEFADPMDAYPVVRSRAEAEAALRALARGDWPYDPAAFLAAHVSFDEARPAAERMADAVETILAAPPLPA